MQNVHGIDDQGTVCGVLANRISELLHWLDGVLLQSLLPAIHLRHGPITVDFAKRRPTILAGLREHFLDQRRLCIIAINQHGDHFLFEELVLISHENQFSGVRTRGSRSIASLPPGAVTNGPPSTGAGLLNATSGSSLGLPASGKS